jgi:P2-related tail formation protein
MEQLNQRLSYLEARLGAIEEKLAQIPIPFKLMYKPPEREHHVNVVQYLDEINKRLKELEKN